MYYANCEWYVDMGEHYKPLCERNSLRPAKCSECPVYIGSIEAENAKLRELVRIMHSELVSCEDNGYVCGGHKFDDRMRDLRIEADG